MADTTDMPDSSMPGSSTRRDEAAPDAGQGAGDHAGAHGDGEPVARPHHPDDYVAQLRRLGVRVTPQRLLVLEALAASGGHVAADALLQWAAERYPALNLATVYRTLDVLVAHGLVAQTDLGAGVSTFELVGDTPHHHLVCERCGAIGDLDAELLAPLRQQLLDTYGFRADLRHVALFGTCRACLAASQPAPQPAAEP